jgi:hypothetical protein
LQQEDEAGRRAVEHRHFVGAALRQLLQSPLLEVTARHPTD